MTIMLSAKGNDVTVWRAAAAFSESFRQALFAKLEYSRSDESALLLTGTVSSLDELADANDTFCRNCEELTASVRQCTEPTRFKELTTTFYATLYNHVGIFHSASSFYQASSKFLQALSDAVGNHAQNRLGQLSRQLPRTELIVLGPAGRQEFSPFCPLQLMLVHDQTDLPAPEALSQLGQAIHEGFEASGLRVDEIITPRNSQWRGSITEWQQRLADKLEQGGVQECVDLFRFADQFTLLSRDGFDSGFNLLCRSVLMQHRSALAALVSRVRNISHGIGMLGGLRYEKKGPYRGLFALRDNALQPLSSSLCVLALLKDLESRSTPQRIREMLGKRELDAGMAERLLQTWHTLHELRLLRECNVQPDWSSTSTLYLNVAEMLESEQTFLRESLDTVGAIQRHVGLTFNDMKG